MKTFTTLILFAIVLALPARLSAQDFGPFFFEGGTPPEFVVAIDEQFDMKGRLVEIAEIDPAMSKARVPKIRIEKGDALGALLVYDELSRSNSRLGRVSMASHDQSRVIQSLSFLPGTVDGAGGNDALIARIYQLGDTDDENLELFMKRSEAIDALVRKSGGEGLDFRYHADGGLLLVRAAEHDHALVASLVEGYLGEMLTLRRERSQREAKIRMLRSGAESLKRQLASLLSQRKVQREMLVMAEWETKVVETQMEAAVATESELIQAKQKQLNAEKDLQKLESTIEEGEIKLNESMMELEQLEELEAAEALEEDAPGE